jgi:hypothetical protein
VIPTSEITVREVVLLTWKGASADAELDEAA